MAVTVNRANREIRGTGAITFDITGLDVGKTYDFMGVAEGFRITGVNVTVDEAFANADNTVSVGTEDSVDKLLAVTAVDAIKGIAGKDTQFTAPQNTPIVVDIKGSPSATGKATVTVEYLKLPTARQEY